MDDKLKKHQFVHVTSVEEEETDDIKCLNENCEHDGSDSVPLGLSGKAVCIQVRLQYYFNDRFMGDT